MQVYCINRALDFIFEEEDLMMIRGWYLDFDGKIVIRGKMLEMEIDSMLSYALIKKAFKSCTLTGEQQDSLK
jgi:hypothetical protein